MLRYNQVKRQATQQTVKALQTPIVANLKNNLHIKRERTNKKVPILKKKIGTISEVFKLHLKQV